MSDPTRTNTTRTDTAQTDSAQTDSAQSRGALLVGSVSLDTSEDVFRAVGQHLARHLPAVPDGEPGARAHWISFQAAVFDQHPDIERVPRTAGEYGEQLPLYRLRRNSASVSGDSEQLVQLGRLGYAESAQSSYALFRRLRDEGVLPSHVRFQICLPTPVAVTAVFIDRPSQPDLEAAYEATLLAELREIQKSIPASDLAIQWDLPVETAMWEGIGGLFTPWFESTQDGLLERIGRITAHVADDVNVGIHLCYGDLGGEAFVQPVDAAKIVGLTNRIVDRVHHPLAWVHIPVPRSRADQAYFAPLSGLRLPESTDLYLGVIHAHEHAGTNRRIAAAKTAVSRFGVATECGIGRVPREDIADLLTLHAQVAHPH